MSVAEMSPSERLAAVNAYNARHGEMDSALWCLSQHCRAPLLEGHSAPVVEELVWTVKSWWGVIGVSRETKALMAEALVALPWMEDLFKPQKQIADDFAEFALVYVMLLVKKSETLGAPRREFSLASKVLHWLLPWHVPAYDSFICKSLGIPTSSEPHSAYLEVAQTISEAVRRMEGANSTWTGSVEPRSPLRALHKCLWWLGGGSAETAAVVKNPWRVTDRLGLRCK